LGPPAVQCNPDYVLICVDIPLSHPALGWVLLPDKKNRVDRKFFEDLNTKYYELRGWSFLFMLLTFRMLKDFKFVRVALSFPPI